MPTGGGGGGVSIDVVVNNLDEQECGTSSVQLQHVVRCEVEARVSCSITRFTIKPPILETNIIDQTGSKTLQ